MKKKKGESKECHYCSECSHCYYKDSGYGAYEEHDAHCDLYHYTLSALDKACSSFASCGL